MAKEITLREHMVRIAKLSWRGLTKEQRSERARKSVASRWRKYHDATKRFGKDAT